VIRIVVTFLLLFGVWMLWSGHTEPLMVELGLGSCALVVWLSARMKLLDEEAYPYRLVTRLLGYIPWVLWQVVLTNIDAAKLILGRETKVDPVLVKIRVKQQTTLGQVIHANTITLTPGTVTLDVRDHVFLIHALTPESASEDQSGVLDDKVAKLER
jgi:multicomponent Na+:H+ antiporter subunit E